MKEEKEQGPGHYYQTKQAAVTVTVRLVRYYLKRKRGRKGGGREE